MKQQPFRLSATHTVRNLKRLGKARQALSEVRPENTKQRQLKPELLGLVDVLGLLLCEPCPELDYAVPEDSQQITRELLESFEAEHDWGVENDPDRLRLVEARQFIDSVKPRGIEQKRGKRLLFAAANYIEHLLDRGMNVDAWWLIFELVREDFTLTEAARRSGR